MAGIRGKTISLAWAEGPTKGTTHEHVFHLDGIFEWRYADGQQKSNTAKEKPEYAAINVVASEKFLKCWKDADTRHPELVDARQRLLKLKSR